MALRIHMLMFINPCWMDLTCSYIVKTEKRKIFIFLTPAFHYLKQIKTKEICSFKQDRIVSSAELLF